MVLQETGYCRGCNLRIWIRCCQDSCSTMHCSSHHIEIPWCTHWRSHSHVWWQWICGGQLNSASVPTQEEAPCPVLPLRSWSHCVRYHFVSSFARRGQPIWHLDQTLGLLTDWAHPTRSYVLAGWYDESAVVHGGAPWRGAIDWIQGCLQAHRGADSPRARNREPITVEIQYLPIVTKLASCHTCMYALEGKFLTYRYPMAVYCWSTGRFGEPLERLPSWGSCVGDIVYM